MRPGDLITVHSGMVTWRSVMPCQSWWRHEASELALVIAVINDTGDNVDRVWHLLSVGGRLRWLSSWEDELHKEGRNQ